MALKSAIMLVLATLLLLGTAQACVFRYGNAPHPLKAHAIHYDYSFAGADWFDEQYRSVYADSMCMSGKQQSPINVPHIDDVYSLPKVSAAQRTTFHLGSLVSNGTSVEVVNNGHTIQVQWYGANQPTISVAVPLAAEQTAAAGPLNAAVIRGNHSNPGTKFQRVTYNPFQFHFHTHSEHLIGGVMYPLELHIVTQTRPGTVPGCSATLGCLAVVGIMFEVDPDTTQENPFINKIWEYMPYKDGEVKKFPAGTVLNFDDILPGDQTYVTYEGSLTTPPCWEGILWHVLTQPMKISKRQYEMFMNATGDEECEEVHAARRKVLSAEWDATKNYTCEKLGAGINYRVVQPVLDRKLKAFVDTTERTVRMAPMVHDYSALMRDSAKMTTLTNSITANVAQKTGLPASHVSVRFFPYNVEGSSVVPEVTVSLPNFGWSTTRLLDAAMSIQDTAVAARRLSSVATITKTGSVDFASAAVGAVVGVVVTAVAVMGVVTVMKMRK